MLTERQKNHAADYYAKAMTCELDEDGVSFAIDMANEASRAGEDEQGCLVEGIKAYLCLVSAKAVPDA